MTELWLRNPKGYIREALECGFRNFTWDVTQAILGRVEVLSWIRTAAVGYSDDVTLLLTDFSGAALYSIFDRYEKPQAVYPTWTPEDKMHRLEWLMQNNIGNMPEFTGDTSVPTQQRPVAGQAHRVVVHRIGKSDEAQRHLVLQLREMQQRYPECELFVSGMGSYSAMFDYGFTAVDYRPICMSVGGSEAGIFRQVVLPTGKLLHTEHVHDPRYTDWFNIIGWDQRKIITKEDYVRVNLDGLRWAHKNFKNITPFVSRRSGKHQPQINDAFVWTSDKDFILPAARRRVMRNIGIKPNELDQFTCNTCILHNACTLYRKDSVCTVKGSDTVALADSFGTRNSDAIIGGLVKLLQRNAERLEDAQAREDNSDELDPEVTKLYKTVFDQGVKLAKLIDPSLSGAKVHVNINNGQQANLTVATADPRKLVASIVAELEAAGVPREKITSEMIKGALTAMAKGDDQKQKSIAQSSAVANVAVPKVIKGELAF